MVQHYTHILLTLKIITLANSLQKNCWVPMASINATKTNSTCEKLSIRIIRFVRITRLLYAKRHYYKSSYNESVQNGLKIYLSRISQI